MPKVKCVYCGEEVYKRPSLIKKSKVNTCSPECYYSYIREQSPEANRECLNCGKKFRTNPAYIKRRPNSGGKYCSRKCFYEYIKENGLDTGSHKKGKGWVSLDGYKLISVNNKSRREHRVIMENHLGRKLRDKEIVHHKNGNKLDNRLENLEIMTQSEHIDLMIRDKKGRLIEESNLS